MSSGLGCGSSPESLDSLLHVSTTASPDSDGSTSKQLFPSSSISQAQAPLCFLFKDCVTSRPFQNVLHLSNLPGESLTGPHDHSLIPKACAPYLSPLSHAEVTSQAQEISATRRNLETGRPLPPDPRADTFPERDIWVSQVTNSQVNELFHKEQRTTDHSTGNLHISIWAPTSTEGLLNRDSKGQPWAPLVKRGF